MNDIYVSTVCLPNTIDIAQRIDSYCLHGIKSIELGGRVRVKDKLQPTLKRYDCNFIIHNYFPPAKDPFYINLSSPEDAIRIRSIEYIKDNIELSAEIGTNFYSFHAGFITDPIDSDANGLIFQNPPANQQMIAEAVDRFVDSLSILIPHAELYDVHLAIENNICRPVHIGQLLLQTFDEFVTLFQRISSDYLGVLVDIGHLQVTSRTLGYDSKTFLHTLKPYIKAFHLNQNDGLVDSAEPIDTDNELFEIIKSFTDAKMIVEANFENIADLVAHTALLKSELGR